MNVLLVVALFGSQVEPARAQSLPRAEPDDQRAPAGPLIQAAAADTVHVAPPTGDETDRASILAALAQAGPGDVIQFAPGTYVVGEIIPIETAQLTILGHGNGTTLRGCDTRAYERMERETEAAGDDQWARMTARNTCGVFEMTGGHGTIRGLTFEYTWVGLALGAGHSDSLDFHLDRVTDGGYLVEDNVFRNSGNGVRPGYLSGAATVIRGNRFMNLGHAVSGAGAGIHVLGNDISVPDPDFHSPLFAIGIGPAQECVVEGNRIEGHSSGIVVFGAPGEATRGNVIRDNTIIGGASLPLGLWADPGDAEVEDNLIERNRIMGAVGAGIALNRASRNRILDNTITGIALGDPSFFEEANGAGLWVSPGSDENEIVGNTFEDIATHAIVLEGDRNVVRTRGGSEAVHDLGTGNRVTGPDSRPGRAQAEHENHESAYVETPGVRLHYLDFGGSGLPVIFVHGSHGDAHSFASFAPRFADGFRVLALDRRGRGRSEDVPWGYDVATQGEDLLDFMDALGLERAVLVGNVAGPAAYMTYLAEHHPERLAGLVFLAHAPAPWRPFRSGDEPVREFWEMAERTACDWDEETREREGRRRGYRPHFAVEGGVRIDVPALSFVNPEGTRYPADFDFLGVFLQQARTGEWCDEEAKAYFTALAENEERADDLRARLAESTGGPAGGMEFRKAFERAFGTNLHIVRLEIPSVTGYEYRGAPDLIYPHIRRFLEGLSSR